MFLKQIENGLVEAIALLMSKMPRLRPFKSEEKLGECYNTKPEFMKVTYILELCTRTSNDTMLNTIHLSGMGEVAISNY